MFIGRESELKDLEEPLKYEKPSLFTVIGRRGVGKTYMLDNFFQNLDAENSYNHILIRIKGQKSLASKKQMKSFLLSCDDFFSIKEIDVIVKNNDWSFLFKQLVEKIKKYHSFDKNKKIIFFIDEFAWLNTKQSGFIQAFSGFWNDVASLTNIHFYVTASAIAWMNKQVINSVGGLHGRVTHKINLKPFNFLETVKFLYKTNKDFNVDEYLTYYFFTGGVPRYLNRIKGNNTIGENGIDIFKNVTTVSGSEFEELFTSSFDSKTHIKIIELFKEKGKWEAKDIVKKINEKYKISSPSVYAALDELSVSGILSLRKHLNKTNEGTYYLVDLFCCSFLKILKENFAKNSFYEHRFDIMFGYAFEILSFSNIDMIKNEIKRNGFDTIENKWQNKNAQIDLLINYLNTNSYSIIECKAKNKIFEIDNNYICDLKNKKNEFIEEIQLKNKKIKSIKVDFIIFSLYGSKTIDKNFNFLDVSLEKIVKNYIKYNLN